MWRSEKLDFLRRHYPHQVRGSAHERTLSGIRRSPVAPPSLAQKCGLPESKKQQVQRAEN